MGTLPHTALVSPLLSSPSAPHRPHVKALPQPRPVCPHQTSLCRAAVLEGGQQGMASTCAAPGPLPGDPA